MKLQFQAHQPGNSAIRANRTVEPNQSTAYKSVFKRKNLFFEIFGDFSGIKMKIPGANAPGITIIQFSQSNPAP